MNRKEIKPNELIVIIAVSIAPVCLCAASNIGLLQIFVLFWLGFAGATDMLYGTISNICPAGISLCGIFSILSKKSVESGLKKIVISCLVFLALLIFSLITKESLGGGDIKLIAALSLFSGLKRIIICTLTAIFIAGLFSSILLITKRKNRKSALPFAPFILLGYLMRI